MSTNADILARGHVPTAAVAPFLRRYLYEENDDPGSEAHGSLPRILKRWENEQESAEFCSVDRVFCQISDVPLALWLEISDIYYGVDLEKARFMPGLKYCAREGCGREVPPKTHTGGRERIYCSNLCRRQAHKHRTGTTPAIRRLNACPQGHEKTDENWRQTQNGKNAGKWYCAACNRAKAKRQRQEAATSRMAA